jgi:hypothetical protein
MVTIKDFRDSLSGDTPMPMSIYLLALWYDGRGDWAAAHDLVNEMDGPQAAWVHAYLHRKEGDLANARYWYGRALKKFPQLTLEEEWTEIATALLGEG